MIFKIKTKFKIDYYGKEKTIKYARTFKDCDTFLDFLTIFVHLKDYLGFKVIEKDYSIMEVKK